jgi:uncharacterized protein (DUF1684 family)
MSRAQHAYFGAARDVFFSVQESIGTFVYRVSDDGSGLDKAIATPVYMLYGVSPDGKRLAVWDDAGRTRETANSVRLHSVDGGTPVVLCSLDCAFRTDGSWPQEMSWSADGTFVYLAFMGGSAVSAVPLSRGEVLPPLPAAGIRSIEQAAALRGVKSFLTPGAFPGPTRRSTRIRSSPRSGISSVYLCPNLGWRIDERTSVRRALSSASMRPGSRVVAWCSIVACLATNACQSTASPTDPAAVDAAAATKESAEWRAKHEESYRRNWATIAGLHFLEPGSHTAGTAKTNDIVLPASAASPRIGRFVLTGDIVRFEPEPGARVHIDGEPVTEPIDLMDDAADETDQLEVGAVRLVVHQSGKRKSLRVWDPEGEMARGFLGFRWFDIQMDYRVTGRFIPDATPREVRVPNTFGDLDTYKTEGVVEFTLQGQTLRLRPFTTAPKRFYFVFRDRSSGEETYEAARFLYSNLREDGTVVLDFNQAYNPPCAFNPFTTCPIPLPENRLAVKVLAGERAYPVHVTLRKS